MELRHLRYFLAVADEGSFTRAALKLHVTQPSLSQQIRQLERMVGSDLFTRSKGRGGVALTAVGSVLAQEARAILDHVARSLDNVQRTVDARPRQLRIGVPPWLPPAFVADLADRMAKRLPDVECELETSMTSDTVRRLHDESIDLGLVRAPFDGTDLEWRTVVRQPLGVWLVPGHPLRRFRSVPLEHLDGLPLGIFERSAAPGLHEEVVGAFAARGITPEWHEVASSDTAVLARMRARGMPHVGPRELQGPARGMTWRMFRGFPVSMVTVLAWRKDAGELVAAGVRAITADAGRPERPVRLAAAR
jgi:DNA-binding transcriptional LysR family regulator